MLEVLTAAESREADARSIADGIAGIFLMERAGAATARTILERFEKTPVLVLCGSGNNGGDGFVIARHLQKAGWLVRVACLVKKSALKNEAALAAAEWHDETEVLNSNLGLKDCGLVVDAIFGTGFSGALPLEIVALFDKIRTKKTPVVAVDVPSGVDATSATFDAATLKAQVTITFNRKKLAHVLLPAKVVCGRVVLTDIGIADDVTASLQTQLFENYPALWVKDYPVPDAEQNKFSRGHVVVLGGRRRTGAACLSAHAAQKIGAGLVSILSSPEAWSIYSAYRASLMVDVWQNEDELKALLRDERKNVFVAGCGLGTGEAERASILSLLAFNKFGVLDADVFSLFKDNPQELFERLSTRHVLTPHEGEFARLFGDIAVNKVERARHAAKVSGAHVVLKGSDTVIAAPDGTAVVNTNAPPNLATAGAGDVLAGMIAGLMAQGMNPFMAASAAVWVHGKAGQDYGFCLTAEDIISQLNQSVKLMFEGRFGGG